MNQPGLPGMSLVHWCFMLVQLTIEEERLEIHPCAYSLSFCHMTNDDV